MTSQPAFLDNRTEPDRRGDGRDVLVVAPTTRELGGIRDGLHCRAATVGIGRDAAPSLRALIQESHPSLVVSLGFAGALQPGLRPSALTLHTTSTIADASAPPLPFDASFLDTVRTAFSVAGVPCHEGPLLTVDRVLLTPSAKHAHGAASGALAVDMEGYWLAQVAAEAGIPTISVRAILDAVDHRLPALVDAIIADAGHNEWRHVLRALRKPWTAAALLPLALRSAQAGRSLRRAAAALLPALQGAAESVLP